MMKPELLMPAGTLEKLKIAFQYGADAVYAGVPELSLRMRVNEFDKDSLEKGINYAHKLRKKIYVTVNIFPHNEKIKLVEKQLKWLKKVKPDGIIISDLGVFEMAKKICPEIDLHVSTQANSVNYKTVECWKKLGAKRVILGREASLKEIKEIHEKVPNIELETFVHGAMCMSYSGRCFLSMFLASRDANQGDCAQCCRWRYKLKRNLPPPPNLPLGQGEGFNLEEEFRPGEYYPVEEDQHGAYILSSKDLCMIEHLRELKEAGICSFKVEGRSKTEMYVATIARAYRKAIDDMISERKFDKKLLEEVSAVSTRGLFTGFYFGKPDEKSHTWESSKIKQDKEFIGIVMGNKRTSAPILRFASEGRHAHMRTKKDEDTFLYKVEIRNRIKKGEEIEILTPNKIFVQKVNKIFDQKGREIDVAHGGVGQIMVEFDRRFDNNTILRRKLS